MVIKSGVVLTISSAGSLNIDLANYSLKIADGGGVLIREGGKVD